MSGTLPGSPAPQQVASVKELESTQPSERLLDLSAKTYLGQRSFLLTKARQSESPGDLPTRVLADLWVWQRDPPDLFACSLRWHAEADTGAGWERLRGLRLSRYPRIGLLASQQENWLGFYFPGTAGREHGSGEIKIRSRLTHEEMAQTIGSACKTVTRLLSELRKKELIWLEGSTLIIRNRMALEALAA